MKSLLLSTVMLTGLAGFAAAETELSFYTGIQTAPHGSIDGDDDGADFDFDVEWEGRSGEAPPYYGFRYTRWQDENWGWGVELNHAKVYADDDTLDDNGFDNLELTDGLNLLTVNGMYRWQNEASRWTPYVGAGAGFAIPHVDVKIGDNRTFGYQLTGLAVVAMAGVSYDINDTWAVFGEYKGSFSSNTAELDGGGELSTDIITNAVNLGVTYKW
ncbi:outer membrane beta-barrel protein [Cognatishimia sp. MH4019]|uniref:outer membrane protein n=1 Tax=Cognatishimia sp. MH4019 TaxID=2854030 RepID=UPI001CD46480